MKIPLIALMTLTTYAQTGRAAQSNRLVALAEASSSLFNFESAQNYFNEATSPAFNELLGTWTEVGTAELPGFPDGSTPDAYDPAGLKNSDGSLSFVLQFSLDTTFDGSLQPAVSILNIGSSEEKQGPTPVSIASGRASFWQWAYSGAQHSAHYGYECRLMKTSADKMICANIYHIDNTAGYGPEWLIYDNTVTYYVGYSRH